MPTTADTLTLLQSLSPGDLAAHKSLELTLLLLSQSPHPFSRDQFSPGHITTSALVISPNSSRILTLHHRRLDRWLLPGGHVESGDASLAHASAREVIEETGIPLDPASATLLSADVHGIPPKHHEPYHLHHDLLFLFRADTLPLQLSDESHAVAWSGPEDFERLDLPLNVRRVWGRLAADPRSSA